MRAGRLLLIPQSCVWPSDISSRQLTAADIESFGVLVSAYPSKLILVSALLSAQIVVLKFKGSATLIRPWTWLRLYTCVCYRTFGFVAGIEGSRPEELTRADTAHGYGQLSFKHDDTIEHSDS